MRGATRLEWAGAGSYKAYCHAEGLPQRTVEAKHSSKRAEGQQESLTDSDAFAINLSFVLHAAKRVVWPNSEAATDSAFRLTAKQTP